MSFCTNCGSALADGARFCTGCGSAVAAPKDPPAPPPTPAYTPVPPPPVYHPTPTPPLAPKLDYTIQGDNLQIIRVRLKPGQELFAEAGKMVYKQSQVQWETRM